MAPNDSSSSARAGVLLVDKPEGITSHGVVARLRRALSTRKVGHAGTLDPMATGLLIAGVGSSTRLLTHLVGADKEYLATIRLGLATTTDDREGEQLSEWADARGVPETAIRHVIASLTGDIEQVPSSVSAIKVDGKRSYARVRAGEDVALPARPVTVSAFDLLARSEPTDEVRAVDLEVRVECSSGTYIRALARDLGAALGVGGHLTALRRTRVGPFGVDRARPLDDLQEPPVATQSLMAPAAAASELFPIVEVDEATAAAVRNGRRVPVSAADAPLVAIVGPGGALLALTEVRGGVARVVTGFPQEAHA